MSKLIHIILIIFCASNVVPEFIEINYNKNYCSSLSCVHASASILDLIEPEIEPCDDFYEYACGNFVEEVYTPDDKSALNTLTLMNDKLTEYLLTVYTKPFNDTEKKLHRLSKKLYQSCTNRTAVKNRSKYPLLVLLEKVGFPMLDGPNWNETNWNWKTSLLNLRQHISNKTDDIFKAAIKRVIENNATKSFTDDEISKIEPNLKQLMRDVVIELGGKNDTLLNKDIEELIEFEKELAEFYRKKVTYINPPNATINRPLKNLHKRVLWMELFSKSYFTNEQKYNGTLDASFIKTYYKFINNTSIRTLANYVGWRVVQSALSFMHDEIRDAELKFQKKALAKEDFEQRWMLCVTITQIEAPVSTGSLFVEKYFPIEDKNLADLLVESLLKEYNNTIDNSIWMDGKTKEAAKNTIGAMRRFIGYHDTLITTVADEYYDDLYEHPEDKFLEMGLGFKIFETDRLYKRLYDTRFKNEEDWTKYSKPATINAFYNAKDNSIQFPAAILQSPNFDKNRPNVMNFGAIGSIIGHEITHAFDNLAAQIKNSSDTKNAEDYINITQCFIEQYNNYHVTEVDFIPINFTTDGIATLKENIADCGGVKLAYNTFKNWSLNANITKAIGLDEFSDEKIFWISFAQTYCSVERPAVLNNKDIKYAYALNRFRVIGPISNMKEFATDFGCKVGTKMNPAKRCAVF